MTDSYFKVANEVYDVFFFDTRDPESVRVAFDKAYAKAKEYVEAKRELKDKSPDLRISVWLKPNLPGPWVHLLKIGESGRNIYAPETLV